VLLALVAAAATVFTVTLVRRAVNARQAVAAGTA
jgi:hypothetical protein